MSGDRVMSVEHARRLAALLPRGELAWGLRPATPVPLDPSGRLAALLVDFVRSVCTYAPRRTEVVAGGSTTTRGRAATVEP